MAWKPRIEEPSKLRPSSKTSWVNDEIGNGEVLHDAGQVAEADVDHLDALVLDVLQQFVAVCEHSSSLAAPDPGRPTKVCASGAAGATLHRYVPRNLGGGSFLTVSGLFRACNRSRPVSRRLGRRSVA